MGNSTNRNNGSGIAPAELVRDDYREESLERTLRMSWDVEQLVLMQSVAAHAHCGDGAFRGRRFRDTTEDDIARALRMDPEAVKADRQHLIDEVRDYIDRTIRGEANGALTNVQGQPLFRISTLRYLDVDPKGVLQGIYLGGMRDDPNVRVRAEKQFDVRIGSGEMFYVDRRVLREMHIDGGDLAHEEHANEIDRFRRRGLIFDKPRPGTARMFVRYATGPGLSDDAAIVMAGKLYGLSATVGSFLADAIDTFEKYALGEANQDVELAAHIKKNYKDLGLDSDDAAELAFLSAPAKHNTVDIPNSSLRELLEINRTHDINLLESHMLYVMGKPTPEMVLNQGHRTNHDFYSYVDERLRDRG